MSNPNVLPILELINRVASDAEHKDQVSVLPLMCGTGKSTTISYKIKEAIENNSGLLVVTDRKQRLTDYLTPRDEELKNYLKDHSGKIAKLVSGKNLRNQLELMHCCPVLLMTTQRYFNLKREELIEHYLKWDNGQRSLIIFDEQPELYSDCTLDIASVSLLEGAIIECLREIDDSISVFRFYHDTWRQLKDTMFNRLLLTSRIPTLKNYCILLPAGDESFDSLGYFRKSPDEVSADDIEQLVATLTVSNEVLEKPVYIENPVTQEEEEMPFPDLESKKQYLLEEAQRQFRDHLNDVVNSADTESKLVKTLEEFFHQNRKYIAAAAPNAPLTLKGLLAYRYQDTVYSFRSRSTGSYEDCIHVALNNKSMLTDLNSKVIILDGTADITPDYRQDYLRTEDCSSYRRRIPNLHLILVNEATSRQNVFEKIDGSDRYVQSIMAYILQKTGINTQCIFTYKQVYDLLQEEIVKEEVNETRDEFSLSDLQGQDMPDSSNEESKSFVELADGKMAYLGNLRGLNSFLSYRAFGQIGLFRKPNSYYLSHYLDRAAEESKAVCAQAAFNYPLNAQLMDEIQKKAAFRAEMYGDILADIEQNVFRAPIRSADYKEEVYYFLFFDLFAYSGLVEMIKERFHGCYGADVKTVEEPSELHQIKTAQKMRKGKLTIAAKCIQWINGLQAGTEFSAKDIAEGTGLTKEEVSKAKEKNKELHSLLDKMQNPAYKKGRFIKS